jgi:hypothetical protein
VYVGDKGWGWGGVEKEVPGLWIREKGGGLWLE